MAFVHQALLAVSVVALADGGFRLASLAATGGLERVVATATLAAAAATLEALLLGLIGLGTEPLALAPAAAVTWLAAWRLLPSPADGGPRRACRMVARHAVLEAAGVGIAGRRGTCRERLAAAVPGPRCRFTSLSRARGHRVGPQRAARLGRRVFPVFLGRQLPRHQRGVARVGQRDRAQLPLDRDLGTRDHPAAGRSRLDGPYARSVSIGLSRGWLSARCASPRCSLTGK